MIKEKDMKWIAKQFKYSEKSLMSVKNIYFGFIKANEKELLYSEVCEPIDMEEDLLNLVLKNLKKVYSGKNDIKAFTPTFLEEEIDKEDSFYKLINRLETKDGDFKENCDKVASKIAASSCFEDNVVLVMLESTIIKEDLKRNLITGTICKTKMGTTNFIFKGNVFNDVSTKKNEFILQSSIDPNIILNIPMEGFSYPVLNDATALKGEILYYSNKANTINSPFVSKVLGCDVKLTALQEQIFFNSIISEVSGGKLAPKDLYSIYNSLDILDEELELEERIVSKFEIKKALEKIEIKEEMTVEEAFEKLFGFDDYNFKVSNIIPNKEKKSISISNDDADIKVKPESLQNLKKIQTEDGQIYLMIPLNDDVSTNGFDLPMEEIK